MRLFSTSLFCLLLLSTACTTYRGYESTAADRLTNLRFPARSGSLDLFFQGESKPERDYLRLGLVKKNRVSRESDIKFLMNEMKKEALAMGADGLIVMGTADEKQIETNLIVDDTYSVPRESMWGIAIKYMDEIEFTGNILGHLEVVPLGAGSGAEGGNISFDYYGEPVASTNNTLTRYAYLHSLEYLLDSKKGWTYAKSANPEYGYHSIYQRRRETGGNLHTQLKVKMRTKNVPGELEISSLGNGYENKTMTIQTDDQGRIYLRSWEELGGKKVKVTREYNAAGLPASELYENKARGVGSYQPYLQVYYKYLTETEFRALLEEEQIVRVKP